MKPEQQRIAIACGWKRYHADLWVPPDVEDFSELDCDNLPDYLNDLNAMHEAEKVLLTTEQQNAYYANIAEITWGCEDTGDRQVVFNQLTATAAQRAEAFLKTLGLCKYDD